MHVIIDGIEYQPVSERQSRIGIAITTHNRPDVLKRALEQHQRFLPDGAHIVVVDDGSNEPVSVPEGVALVRHASAKGIAAAKNASITALMDAGCDHLFLFDDDTWPAVPDWWRPYAESPQPHLMYVFGEAVIYRDDQTVGYVRPKGCMLYVERRVVDRVGGMDPRFGTWGFEHESWSDRIHNAGFTTCRYQDVPGSKGLIHALDEHEKIASSVPEIVRQASSPHLAEQMRHSDEYVPYREEARVPTGIALSVLIPSVHTRHDTFARAIQEQIFGQYEALSSADRDRVEILMLTDTKGMSLGDKRNEMVRMARGEYVVFVDDDDRLEPTYLAELLAATQSGADVITFHVSVSLDGGAPKLCRYSLAYRQDANTATEYHRLPNHICAVKRSLALRTPYQSVRYAEDAAYAKDLRPLLTTEHAIGKVLYHYDYSHLTTETQMRQRSERAIVLASRAPVVDVVMLSKAGDDAKRAMTQHAIDTCRAGAGDNPVNVIVIEQAEGVRYRDAITITETDAFAYNRFCNRGAATGSAPWIVFANNDLDFEEGWLQPLLDAGNDVVSPYSPGESRQNGLKGNESGETNGRHFAGWCFMMKRTLWDRIGGLDADFIYWCADDCVIEQMKAVGVKPMVVPASRVKHLVSQTGGTAPPDEWTWEMVALFERKYGIRKFDNDPRYAAWKARQGPALAAVA